MPRGTATKNAARYRDQTVIAGVDKYFAGVASLRLGGESFTPTEIQAIYRAEIDVELAINKKRGELRELLLRATAARKRAHDVHKLFKAYVLSTYGPNAHQLLAALAMTKSPRGKTAETKLAAVKKAKATREARGTMGKRQKAKLKS